MTPDQLRIVVDAIFAELEAKFANKPVMLLILGAIQAAVDGLLPQILKRVNNS